MSNIDTRPPLDSLACVNEACELYGQAGRQNLIVRKVYGADGLRYLRCRCCGREFSERKRTALWNTKVRETKAIAVAEHLAEGNSVKSTARLVKVDASVVRRLNGAVRQHGRAFHDARVHDVQVKALHGDERHGFTGAKGTPAWEAELLDPASKFVLSHVQGRRDETLIRRLLQDGAQRLHNRHDLCSSPMVNRAMRPSSLRSSAGPITPCGAGTGGGIHRCAIGFHARWHMYKSSSITPGGA